MDKFSRCVLALAITTLMGCQAAGNGSQNFEQKRWAIVIHGGAGVISKTSSPERIQAAQDGLHMALSVGQEMLAAGASAMDTVEAVIVTMENNPNFNAGKGAVYTATGTHELDASIMNGATLECGAATGITTVKNPIRLARRVMEQTPHVLLSAQGAELFADSQPDLERVPNSYYDTERRHKSWERWKKKQSEKAKQAMKSTVGCAVLDQDGNLAAGTSTGGMTGKRFGRIGDSPIIGAGNYASNDTCAVSCTGTGEEYIRHGVARDVADRMRYGGASLQEAADAVIHTVLQPEDGGLIAVDHKGNIVMSFNTGGMFRGAADSTGLFELAIWEDALPE